MNQIDPFFSCESISSGVLGLSLWKLYVCPVTNPFTLVMQVNVYVCVHLLRSASAFVTDRSSRL